MASSSSGVRAWRTAFLTLRDETLASPSPPALLALLRDLTLSHSSDALVAAATATDLPPHEVISDLVLLAELASASSACQDADDVLLWTFHLFHDVSYKVFLDISIPSWTIILSILQRIVERTFSNTDNKTSNLDNTSKMRVIAEMLDILRFAVKPCRRNNSTSQIMESVKLLVCLVSYMHAELCYQSHPHGTLGPFYDSRSRNSACNNLWDAQTLAFSMICDALTGIVSSMPANLWQSLFEVLRKLMDYLASKNLLLENPVTSRLFADLLNCLHLVLMEPKGSLSGHVAGLLVTLQLFLAYGLPSRSLQTIISDLKEKTSVSNGFESGLEESRRTIAGPYRPPHMRRKDGPSNNSRKILGSSDHTPSKYGFTSSDSEHSDSDGSSGYVDRQRSSKVRMAALICIQDLCRNDSKSLASVWTLLLPENDVLQPRKYEANLMTCLLFDPIVKVRIESASTLSSMLDGHSVTLSQVAECKESSKCGSFTTLSNSLGQKLMQLHTGLFYLLKHETHNGLLSSLFKVIFILISVTPYGRMPGGLLPTTMTSLYLKSKEILSSKHLNTDLLVNALSCLGATFSRSSPSLAVLKLLEEDISRGSSSVEAETSMFYLLFHLSDKSRHPIVIYEALQILRAASHSYPRIATRLWEQVSHTVNELLMQIGGPYDTNCEGVASSYKEEISKAVGVTTEKCIAAAIKVLDECLRAISGFKGVDDFQDLRLLDLQRISDSTRSKKISSAPSYELEGSDTSNGDDSLCGLVHWNEALTKHLPMSLSHASPMVRAASLTCFAGMTSGVFSSLTKDKQQFIISSVVTATLHDGVSSVRSAACRAIGVLATFSEVVSQSVVINKFISAADYNSRDPLAAVRITAAWALANICDAIRHRETELNLGRIEDETALSDSLSLLVESALRLTKDGDKIKSNGVRALGNLSRFIRLTYHSATEDWTCASKTSFHGNPYWLERMVQAFVSCVTTGNVKVQWNVCHALSNLFMNETIKLHKMSWAPTVYSILLLLLRDSTNFKIRIHAAVALAVPASRLDYGSSFSDVVQSIEHIRESLASDNSSIPSNFKYKDNLAKQMTLTTLHVLSFVSPTDDQCLREFLIKKATLLEDWFKLLTSASAESSDQPSSRNRASSQNDGDAFTIYVSDKTMITMALRSLLDVYKSSNHPTVALKFERLANTLE